jgi:hypothetical protein
MSPGLADAPPGSTKTRSGRPFFMPCSTPLPQVPDTIANPGRY